MADKTGRVRAGDVFQALRARTSASSVESLPSLCPYGTALELSFAFRWRAGQGLERDRYESDTVSGSKQSGTHRKNLCWQSGRDYIAVPDSREGNHLVIKVIDQRTALGRRWV